MWRRTLAVTALVACRALGAGLEDDAREIIARRCVSCHSAETKTAGLDLSLSPGPARAGLLLRRISSGQMPPGKPLPAAELETLRRWIDAGASPWALAIGPRRAGADWWALQPLRAAAGVPGVDRWVRAKLGEHGLQPAPPADRRTLIRRVTFDLTGLPPTPVEIDQFTGDTRPDAYERLLDRLLASPHYGEHWARHWLDVVRYSESEGFERDWLRDHVWPYRDYVIRSFNQDKPYAQFVREQIAGDVIEPAARDGLIATGLLVMGPTDAVGLTSAVPQERAAVREDQLEEMLGVVSQTFLGLTVNCARCHDHKFDPIPQRDYYRMKAIFEGVWQPTVGDELKADGRPLLTSAEREARESRIAAIRRRIQETEAKLGDLDRRARPKRTATAAVPVAQWTLDTDARDDFGTLHAAVPAPAELRNGRLLPGATLVTEPLDFDLRERTLEVWIHVSAVPEKGQTLLKIRNRSGFRGAATDGIHFVGGKTQRWENASTVNFRTEDVGGPAEDTPVGGRIHLAIAYATDGEIRLYRNGVPYGKPYRPDSGSAHGRLQTYGKGDAIVELTSAAGLELEEARLYNQVLSPATIAASYSAGVVNSIPSESPERTRLVRDLEEARQQLRGVEEPAKVFAVDVRAAEPTRLLLRGDVNRPAEVVAPGAVSCLKTLSGDFPLPPDAPNGERRRQLAEWITHPRNPLFARVIVNRIWHYHFGAGLVDSPNDFGFNGGAPSHPELLDSLAAGFLRTGGSIKRLHRMILTSETYRQSARFDSAAAAKDSGTRLLWRFPPQRLPGEAVRDAMLAASGQIDSTMFGPSFRPFQIVKNPGSYHSYDPVDSPAPELQRRTIYRMNINSGGNPMLDALDCPLPSMKTPRRSATTTSLQALSLMNNPFVDRMAKALASRLTAESADQGRVDLAFQLVLGRPPRPEEAASAQVLVNQAGLASFCWALFNSSEFLYVQ